jgi:ATP-dependent Clp protease ATP-binding subunit ClpB
MTSNIGSDHIQQFNQSSQYQEMKAKVMTEVSMNFKPEFINRIDETVVFHPLASEQIEKIAAIQLSSLTKRLAEQDIKLSITQEALSLISAAGFDPLFGARPLKRAIRKGIENPLAQKILSGEFKTKGEVKIDVKDEALIFSY